MNFVPSFDTDAIRSAIRQSGKKHYVYILCRPNGDPFYVGKGVELRLFFHESEARNLSTKSHKLNLIRTLHRKALRVGYVLDSFFDEERNALRRERELIAILGRHDLRRGPLTNQTDGGEGASNPSAESRQARAATLGGEADDPERRAINQFFNSIGAKHDSVSIKPLGTRKLAFLTAHPSSRQPTERMAKTLVAAAAASGVLLSPNSILPRMFPLRGHSYVIENGVGRDMLKAGMIEMIGLASSPEREAFRLTQTGYQYIIESIGLQQLIDLAVIDPDDHNGV